MWSDPTRARYLPVPSTTHLALQPNDSERQLLQTSKISTRQPSRSCEHVQQLFLATWFLRLFARIFDYPERVRLPPDTLS
jgi:hypothetical protein